MTDLFTSEHCPNLVKVDVEEAQRHRPGNEERDSDCDVSDDEVEQPEWMGLLQPHPDYVETPSDFAFDDGDQDYDWR